MGTVSDFMRLVFNHGFIWNRDRVNLKVNPSGPLTLDENGINLSLITYCLLLDQTAPQSVINGIPNFVEGIYAGKIGVGTVSPDTIAHFRVVNATAVIRLERDQVIITTDSIIGRLEIESNDTDAPGICAKLEAIAEDTAGMTGWRFSAGQAGAVDELMRLSSLGFLGIGVVDPDAKLHIEDVTGAVQRLTRKDDAVTATDIIGRFEFETQDSGSPGIAAYIQAEAEGSAGEVGLVFGTGIGGTVVERMRIKNTGIFKLTGVPIYANNAAAVAGGLVAGDLYRTGGDPDPICIVH